MKSKITLFVILMIFVIPCFALAAPSFTDQGVDKGKLNPGDFVPVQAVKIVGDSGRKIRINALTIENIGTATEDKIEEVRLDNFLRISLSGNDLEGLQQGITVRTNVELAANKQELVGVMTEIASEEHINGGESIKLRLQFHYVYLDEEGVVQESGSSGWVVDGAPETIVRGGFEILEDKPRAESILSSGQWSTIQKAVSTDKDGNTRRVKVDGIAVMNMGTAEGDKDISGLRVKVTVNNSVYTAVQTGADVMAFGRDWLGPHGHPGEVFFSIGDFPGWDGSVPDEGSVTVEIEAKVTDWADPGDTVLSKVAFVTGEEFMPDYPFWQEVQATTTQTIETRGIESIEDVSDPYSSGVVNRGEALVQTIKVSDSDADNAAVTLDGLHLFNLGTATSNDVERIRVYRVKNGQRTLAGESSGYGFADLGAYIDLSAQWGADLDYEDDSSATLRIEYTIDSEAESGVTLHPLIRLKGHEDGQRVSSRLIYPWTLTIYPAGLEILEGMLQAGGSAFSSTRILAQKIRCVDQDENSYDVIINPIVVQNLGTATSKDITKLEIETAAGKTVATTSDLSGFGSSSITLSGLSYADIRDNQEKVFYIYLTIAGAADLTEGHTVQLETTLYHAEGTTNPDPRSVTGPSFYLEVNHPPDVDFSYSPTSNLTYQDTIKFSADVSDPDGDTIAGYKWDFGDGYSTTGETVTHQYQQGGQFTVTLTVTDQRGATGKKSKTLSVAAQPTADFDWEPKTPKVGETVQFSDKSLPSGEITGWEWDFGDGQTEKGVQNPTHSYSNPGTYKVELIVTDNYGSTDKVAKNLTVKAPPTADFSFSPQKPTTGDTVQFTDESTDPDGSISSWSWVFGDGNTSDKQNPTHSYTEPGTYTVKLTVTDNDGLTDSISKDVDVGSGTAPTADFSFSPKKPTTQDSIQFTDQSTDPDGDITSWSWVFGDGNTSDARNPSHSYTNTGTYTVKLEITDDQGNTAQVSKDITIYSPGTPQADFNYSPDKPSVGETITFTDNSSDPNGSISSWSWDFGDGNTSDKQNPTHSYTDPGTYTVTLEVTDNDGLTNSISKDVSVTSGAPPTADFSFSPSSPVMGQTIQFTDESSDPDGSISSWSWDFGDGNSSDSQNPTHSYTDPGTYTVTLEVTDNDGLTNTTSKEINILASVELAIANHFSDCPKDVENPDQIVCKKEAQYASWLYLSGELVPEVDKKMDKKTLEKIISYYLSGKPVVESASPASTSVSPEQVSREMEKLVQNAKGHENELKLEEVLILPNPVRSRDTAVFQVTGQGIAQIKVKLFDLSGQLIFESEWQSGEEISWHLESNTGEMVDNGLYLCVVLIKGTDGEVLGSEVRKVLVMR